MRLLFVCNQNQNRSRTAESLFSDMFETKSAGLYNERPVSEEEIKWANLIVVMEDEHRDELSKRFPKLYMKKQILSLDIPDIYKFGQDELIEILKSKLSIPI